MLRIVVALVAAGFASVASLARAQICTPFIDVPASGPFCTEIQWMFNRGVTFGCTGNQYCPANPVRRDQMAAFIYRLAHDVVFQDGGNAFGNPAVLGTTDNQPLDVRVNNSRVMRYEPNAIGPNVIAGHPANNVTAAAYGATIAGGGTADGFSNPDLVFGAPNRVSDAYGTVGGGYANIAGNDVGTPSDALAPTVSGGFRNLASGHGSTVAGGSFNTASGANSAVTGGYGNVASGSYSMVAGGDLNTAIGLHSFAAGHRAVATASGQFVWSDAQPFVFNPGPNWFNAAHTFNVRATGGTFLVSGIDSGNGNVTSWCTLLPGAGTWTCSSSRDLKTDFERANARDVLEKVAALPIERWRFRGEPEGVRHMGPVAQDFRAAFGLGHDETTISSMDLDGVALAAIQGLNAKVEAQAREIAELRQALANLVAQSTNVAVK